MNESNLFDVVGVGFGPGNLALAIAFDELAPKTRVRFFDAAADPLWQQAMLLDGSDIQNHPCRDLVTLRNPRSRYTFLNYLFEEGRLVEHLNLPLNFPLRKEYARYIQWATSHFLDVVDLDTKVTAVDIRGEKDDARYIVTTNNGREVSARALCLATGRTPYLPPPFDQTTSPCIFHSSKYFDRIRELDSPPRRVAVIGASQSAAEVTLDLARRFPEARINLYTRGPGLALKDTSPFSERGYFPGFVDYYHGASRNSKRALDDYMRRTNYSCVDEDVLHQLYLLMYEQSLDERQRVFLEPNRRTRAMVETRDSIRLELKEVHLGTVETFDADFVVVATGYRDLGPEPHQEPYPPLLERIIRRFRIDDGQLVVNLDYSLEATTPHTPPLFLNGLCESSHGIGDAGSFSLLALRSKIIMDGLLRKGAVHSADEPDSLSAAR